MATYLELFKLTSDQALRQKVAVACIVAADLVRAEPVNTPNHANRLKWAAQVFADPAAEGTRMLYVALAQNRAASVNAIAGASDQEIQTAVNAAVDVFATGI